MNKQIKAGADIHAGDGGYSEGTQEQYDAFVKVRNKSLAQGRIRQLAEQAGLKWKAQPPHYTNTNNPIDFPVSANRDLEKFAELIVRECANMAESFHRHQYDFTGNLELHEFIKEHFGVEE